MFKALRFLTLCLLVGMSLPAMGQYDAPVGLGFRGGVNFGNAVLEPDFSTEQRRGLVLGGILEVGLDGPFYLRVEPMYVERGAQYDVGPDFSTTATLSFVEVPALLVLKFDQYNLNPYFFAGPNLGFKMMAEGDFEGFSGDADEDIEDIDFGIDMGFGMGLDITPTASLLLDARYSYGLLDLARTRSVIDVDSWKTRDFKVLAGLLFYMMP